MIYACSCWSLAGPVFAAAAEELGVSPAFVSKRVSLLEQTLHVMLLHRTTRRVTITEEGSGSTNGRSAFCRMWMR